MTILEALLRLLSMNVLLLVALAIVLGAIVVTRRVHWLPEPRALPDSAGMGNRVTHMAEAIALLCVAAAILVFAATNTSTGGRLLILDRFSPGFARANIVAAAVAGLGVLVGMLTALFYRTSTGVIVAAGTLCIYGLVLNGPATILESPGPNDSTTSDVSLTFILSAPDVEGAELYVNGVRLGTLRYETTLNEFHRRVPFWENEPNELSTGNMLRSWLHVPVRWHPGSSQPSTRSYPPWAEITVPKNAAEWDRPRRSLRADRRARTYYARVKLGDEWGYWRLYGGGSNLDGRYGRRTAVVQLAFIFPARQERIETLLDIARLGDYAPGEEWFEAMETYRSDGWIALRKAMDTEPRMAEVLDRWAAWKYDLDAVSDPESAWKIFERIREEADRRRCYLTSDVAGRAVELLAPKLDPDRLIRLACRIIRSTQLYSWSSWQMNGRTQFGVNLNAGGLQTGADHVTGYSAGGRGDRRLSPGDYAVAHAIWMLDMASNARGDVQPNIVERELVPLFVAQNHDNMALLGIAARIGGPAIERYLLRQDWQADPEDLPYEQQMRIMGSDRINGWLYLLANLQSSAGRQFRQENQHRLIEMTDRLLGNSFGPFWEQGLDFLFLDLDCGAASLAMEYWPRFKEAVGGKYSALSLQYEYLIRMEPLSTVDMYVRCWEEFRGDATEFYGALDVFGKASIPYRKREQICDALVEQVRKDIGNITTGASVRQDLRDELISRLTSSLVPITDDARAADLLVELRAGSPRYTPENVAAWLANGAPTHPLVAMLADADEPSLRLLVMGALREYPTPANRAILEKLLQDKNKQVREAVEAVAADLMALEETPVARFADTETGPTAR